MTGTVTERFLLNGKIEELLRSCQRCMNELGWQILPRADSQCHELDANVTSLRVTSIRCVSEALTEDIHSSEVDSLSEKALSHFHKSGSQFKTPLPCNHLLWLVFSPDLSTGGDFSI